MVADAMMKLYMAVAIEGERYKIEEIFMMVFTRMQLADSGSVWEAFWGNN